MAAHFSEYMAKLVLDKIFVDNVTLPTHASMWLALFHDSTGTTEANLRNNVMINEISDTGYSRIELVLTGGASFNAAVVDTVGMKVTNTNVITVGTAAANYPNSVAFIALCDSSSGGNVIIYSDITSTAVAAGEYIEIDTDDLLVNL